mgnify:CR=1 FL=1
MSASFIFRVEFRRLSSLIKNLDSSLVNEIALDEEIERIKLYLNLEQMRFQDKFTYTIHVDKDIEQQSIKIPPMLLQPFVENAIIHGI